VNGIRKVVATPHSAKAPTRWILIPRLALRVAPAAMATLNVHPRRFADKFTVVENVPTKRKSTNMGLDLTLTNIFFGCGIDRRSRRTPRQDEAPPGSFQSNRRRLQVNTLRGGIIRYTLAEKTLVSFSPVVLTSRHFSANCLFRVVYRFDPYLLGRF